MTPPPSGSSLPAGHSAPASSPASPILPAAPARSGAITVLPIIVAVSSAHLLNDTIQSLLPALYPVLKDELHITFAQVGLITLTFQLTASILQPFVGLYTDRHPQPFSLAAGMVFTLGGVVLLASLFATVGS